MKANQKFLKADDAVSPVIGVILMVAITVVLAAVVFVLVSNLSDSDDKAPEISFDKSDTSGSDTLTVIKVNFGGTLIWNDLDLAAGTITCTTTATGTATITAGEVIDCGSGGGTASIRHIPTNTLVYSTTFKA